MGSHGFKNGRHGGRQDNTHGGYGSHGGRGGYGSHGGRGGRHGGLLGSVLGAIGDRDSRAGGRHDGGRYVEDDGWDAESHGAPNRSQGRAGAPQAENARGLPRFGFGLALVALVIWSLLAWLAYGLADGLIAWTSANAGAILQTGKDAVAVTGVGKEVAGALDVAQGAGFISGTLALIAVFLRPAVIVGWMIGAAVILAAPWLLSRLVRRRFH